MKTQDLLNVPRGTIVSFDYAGKFRIGRVHRTHQKKGLVTVYVMMQRDDTERTYNVGYRTFVAAGCGNITLGNECLV